MKINLYRWTWFLFFTFHLLAVSAQTLTQEMVDVRLSQVKNKTGRGNRNEPILKLTVTTDGKSPVTYTNIRLNMKGTTSIEDITGIKIYTTGDVDIFDPAQADTYLELGECKPMNGDFDCRLNGEQSMTTQYLWITYDISEYAMEGHLADAEVLSLSTTGGIFDLSKTTVEGAREILLSCRRIYAPGEKGSKSYRIPAIITAKDGSLVIATDRRKDNSTDLPEDIDVIVNRSTDGGKTWSDAITIARGTGRYQGYGDAALARTQEEGGLICIFVGGTGFFESTSEVSNRTYICKSSDNGQTWTEPKDITDQLFGKGCSDSVRHDWHGSFCASGAGLLGCDGTVYFVSAVRETAARGIADISNYVYYSRDNGETWHVSSCVKQDNGNEAKIVELNDGTLLVSIRNQHKGPRYYATSKDKGQSWSGIEEWPEMVEPGCDGDIIYYTSIKEGYDKNRMLHSVPAHPSKRENVSVYLSYDEGKTWPVVKSICPVGSAYSSLCILEDGTIGAYVEVEDGLGYYSMYFVNFSLDWLTDGADHFIANSAREE